MKLHEYQSKIIFSQRGIPIPKGRVALDSEEARQICEELGGRVVVKAQVLVTGRGKAGGICLARSPLEAEQMAARILGMEIKGLPVRKVLIDEAVSITKEIYLGITFDRVEGKPLLIASGAGGLDIEELALQAPEKITRIQIDPLLGLRDFQAREIASWLDLPQEQTRQFMEIAQGLWQTYLANDALLAELNPLVITSDGRLIALDCKMTVDDNALFRHPELVEIRDLDSKAPLEVEARKFGITYVQLSGNVCCVANGAGLGLATMDLVRFHGGEPASFLDIGGGASEEKIATALRILVQESAVRGVYINIFGGITRCDEISRGILKAIQNLNTPIPIVVRMSGRNAEEGIALLAGSGVVLAGDMDEGARKIVKMTMEAEG